jgi:hypothetical protein
MKTVTLAAHFDGRHIQLDEPFDLVADTPLLVTVLPEGEHGEQADWVARSKAGLARAYSNDEPDYPASLVRRPGQIQ